MACASNRQCFRLAVVVVGVVAASSSCWRKPVSPGRDSSEPSLAEQVRAVREGWSSRLRLDKTLVRDQDLDALDGLDSRIDRINFGRSEISDQGLARLARCTNLDQLRLSSPRVTDQGLNAIGGLQKLRFLHLLDMPITDAGLDRLHGLGGLESLYLDRTGVTDAGIARLIEALPRVHLHLDDHHHPLDPHAADHQH